MKKWFFLINILLINTCWGLSLNQLHETYDTRMMLYKLAKWPQACEKDYTSNQKDMSQEVLKRGGITIYPFSKTEALVQILCFTAAYQANYYFVFIDTATDKAQVVPFKSFGFDENHHVTSSYETNIAGTATFSNGMLTIYTKGRGAGDCGSLVTYGFSKQGESFVSAARAKECDDNPQSIEHWPWVDKY